MNEVELRQTRELRAGDVLVNTTSRQYEVTRVRRIGRGIRVEYTTADGAAGRFTAAPEAAVRVLVAPMSHAA
ncbi:hypothetical protein M3147_02635 [Agromyces mediolanus]|uniref:hypothetical protein n=1 Tax=Agromyces mediolanus TaxID=41986 RepID=UPI00203B1FFC|nr:hypothetical protein [Agromyces mediolanus]MCM3656141.1 hypothetical protein [Agromyces mediolanus]